MRLAARPRMADRVQQVPDRKSVDERPHVDESGPGQRGDEVLTVVAAEVTLARIGRPEPVPPGGNADDQ